VDARARVDASSRRPEMCRRGDETAARMTRATSSCAGAAMKRSARRRARVNMNKARRERLRDAFADFAAPAPLGAVSFARKYR
jgi:hypothetical protein